MLLRVFSAAQRLFVSSLLLAGAAHGQGLISTFAGGIADGIPARLARLNGVMGLARDSQGNIYVPVYDVSMPNGIHRGMIHRIDPTGQITVIAGSSRGPNFNDGSAENAIISPTALAITPNGGLYFLSRFCLKYFDAVNRTIVDIAGACDVLGGSLGDPKALTVDSNGNVFVASTYPSGGIYRVDNITHQVTKIAGKVVAGPFSGDGGPALDASLDPQGIALDSAGNLFFSDSSNHRVRRIDRITQIVTTVVGDGRSSSLGDGGPATAAALAFPTALSIDPADNLFVVAGGYIRKIQKSTGVISTVAGNGASRETFGSEASPSLQANVAFARGMVADNAGNLWLGGGTPGQVRVASLTTGQMTRIAGVDDRGEGGAALTSEISTRAIATDRSGNVFLSDQGRIRRVDRTTGIISKFAGGGTDTRDGARTNEAGINPARIAFDARGDLLFVEGSRVRKFDAGGRLVTIAGSEASGFSGDGGPATQAKLSPFGMGIGVDSDGNILIADSVNCRVRRIDERTQIIHTIAGNGDCTGFRGDGVATEVPIGTAISVLGDTNGDIYIGTNLMVWKLNPDGQLKRIGGNGAREDWGGDGGSALLAPMSGNADLAFDRDGNLLVMGFLSVRRIAKDSGIIQSVAGSAASSALPWEFVPATSVRLSTQVPTSIATDGNTLFIACESRIYQVTPISAPPLPAPPGPFLIMDAASFAGAAGPGRIVTLLGDYLSPPQIGQLTLGDDGRVKTELNGVRVLFGGVPAPLLYVSPAQINAVVPYSYQSGLPIRLETPGGQYTPTGLALGSLGPTIFPGAILNGDGTLNSREHPSPKGGTLVVFGTGMGALFPFVPDGTVIRGPDLPRPVASISATIFTENDTATFPAQVPYAGPAPNFVAGVLQVNLVLPQGRPSGEHRVRLSNRDVGNSHLIYVETSSPLIQSLNPASPKGGFSGETVTVTGAGFDTNMRAEFFFNGSLEKQVPPALLRSLTQGTFRLTNFSFGVQLGRWGIEVVNPNGRRSPRFEFDVVP